MNTLYLLQFASCIVTAMLAMALAASSVQMRWSSRRYEQSRWMLCVAMATLAGHYVLQMEKGVRASGDEVGAVVNILFYTPVAFLVSFGIFNLECARPGRRRYLAVSAVCYVLILAAFAAGWLSAHSLRIGGWRYAMFALFVASIVFFIAANIREIRHCRKKIEVQTGADTVPFERYTWTCYILLCVSALMLAVAMPSHTLLYIFGPLMLMSLFAFTLAFIGLGYNFMPIDGILDDDNADGESPCALSAGGDAPDVRGSGAVAMRLPAHRADQIAKALDGWCAKEGFRDSTANMPSLSRHLKIPRDELSLYFDCCLNCTFRVWLSDIRFREAQRILMANPTYSNAFISAECGFSSHAHLYKIFKAKTGMSPGQWRETFQFSGGGNAAD